MSPPRILVDTSVPLYALGAPSPWQADCAAVLLAIADERIEACASTEMIQEALHHRLRVTQDRARSVQQCQQLRSLVTLLAFDARVLDVALELVRADDAVRGRDAVHAATAIAHGIGLIASTDPAFDAVPGLTRLTPAQALANLG
jgi:predicted nucleic acid-binding protein